MHSLRKSGVPDAPSRRHIPLVVQIETHPKNVHQLLIAYEGGVVLLDIKTRTVVHTYQLRLLPGAPGAGTGGDPNAIWTERSSAVTCITWRPDGEVFAAGHEDGCLSFWHVKDDGKPLLVRTLDQIDVDRPQVGEAEAKGVGAREPIFKLAWSGFPEQSWLDYAKSVKSRAGAQGSFVPPTATEGQGQVQAAGTVLTILGGAVPLRDAPGLMCLHLPAFTSSSTLWASNSNTPEGMHKQRMQLRASLDTTRESRYITPSTVEDFVLMPKNNPHYSMNYDPVAIITLLAAEPNLPALPPPAAARGLKCYGFPPLPPNARGAHRRSMSTYAGQPFRSSAPEWQLPLPLTFAGSGAILGASLEMVSTHVYRKLGGTCVDPIHTEALSAAAQPKMETDSLNLRGGKAYPIVAGDPTVAPEQLARKLEHRILITWHLDGTVRFHDASPHLLLHTAAGADGTQAHLEATIVTSSAAAPGENVLEHSFPAPMPHLTISTRELIHHQWMSGHPTLERLKSDQARLSVVDVKFAPEVLEVAIVLRSGPIFYFKHGFAKASETDAVAEEVAEELEREAAAASSLIPAVDRIQDTPQTDISTQDAKLDAAMSDALNTLEVRSSPNAPARPPRPPRDPNRPRATDSPSGSPVQPSHRPEARGLPPPSAFAMAPPARSTMPAPQPRMLASRELTDLAHLSTWTTDGFKPHLLIDLNRGDVSSVAVSDMGFFAAAAGSSLALVDLRGPELILRDAFGDEPPPTEEENRDDRKWADAESKSVIQFLSFSVIRTASDPMLAPRLFALRENGFLTVWTLAQSLDQWLAVRTSGRKLEGTTGTRAILTLDVHGFPIRSTAVELQKAQRDLQKGAATEEDASRCGVGIFVSKNRECHLSEEERGLTLLGTFSELTVRYGVDGSSVSKFESTEPVLGANVVTRSMERIIVMVTSASIYSLSLPSLDVLDRKQRHHREQGQNSGYATRAVVDESGDFIDLSSSLDVRLWTIFATLPRAGPPSYMLYNPGFMMPIHPGIGASSVAAAVTGWFSSKTGAVTTGGQLDEILAGAERPPAPQLPEPLGQRASYVPPVAPGSQAAGPSVGISGRKPTPYTKAGSTLADAQTARNQGLLNIDLAKQRGEMMSGLEEGLSNLERGASEFSKNLKNMAIQSAAKDRLKSLF